MLTKQRLFLIGILLIAIAVVIGVLVVVNDDEDNPVNSQNHTPVAGADNRDAEPFFSGDRALDNAEMIMDFGPHVTSSDEILMLGDAIIERLEAANWEVVTIEFEHDAEGVIFPARNIIAKKGEGPITMLASHYDSRMVADNDPNPDNRNLPVPGANDGASSTAALLEFADVIDEHYELNEQIWLVFFDAEDNGRVPGWNWIEGSRYMANNLEAELNVTPEDFRLMILFDMIGERDSNGVEDEGLVNGQRFPQEGYSISNAPEQTMAIWAIAAELGYEEVFVPEPRGNITDDHVPFIERGIPAVDIIDLDYPSWHTIADTLDKLSAESLGRVGEVVELYLIQTEVIEAIAE
jgi:hypothetical protein